MCPERLVTICDVQHGVVAWAASEQFLNLSAQVRRRGTAVWVPDLAFTIGSRTQCLPRLGQLINGEQRMKYRSCCLARILFRRACESGDTLLPHHHAARTGRAGAAHAGTSNNAEPSLATSGVQQANAVSNSGRLSLLLVCSQLS